MTPEQKEFVERKHRILNDNEDTYILYGFEVEKLLKIIYEQEAEIERLREMPLKMQEQKEYTHKYYYATLEKLQKEIVELKARLKPVEEVYNKWNPAPIKKWKLHEYINDTWNAIKSACEEIKK